MRVLAFAAAAVALAACTPSASTAPTPTTPPVTNAATDTAARETPAAAGAYAKPADAELKARLSHLQYEVTQHAATEPPFRNLYWDNHEPGIYVDVVTGEPLFASTDKFESGTGWPSFTRPIEAGHVLEHEDDTLGMSRTEVVSKGGRSHLGHVFDDGPAPTGKRYCINSASLRFVPASKLAAEGYAAYAKLFGGTSAATPPPAATKNACALPPPGAKPGCNSTFETAIFRADAAASLEKKDGVLEIARGFEGSEPAIEVTYDPAKVSLADLAAAGKVFADADAPKNFRRR